MLWRSFKDGLEISPVILSEFKQINFCLSWDHHKSYGFLMISWETEIN